MNICVCIKPINHICTRSGRDPRRCFVGPYDTVQRINPHDEAAMAMAVRLKNEVPDAQVLALTIGPVFARQQLDNCLALGADQFYRIEPVGGVQDLKQPDPSAKAAWVAKVVQYLGASVVLCGQESLDRRNGLFGAFLAQRLGHPFVSGISELRIGGRKGVEATQYAGRGQRRVIGCSLPAVFSVSSGPSVPRLPPHVSRLAVRRKPAGRVLVVNGGMDNMTRSMAIVPPKPRSRQVEAPDNGLNGFERVGQLLSARRVQKNTQMVEGGPEQLADCVMAYLRDNGYLPEDPQPAKS